MLKVLLLEDEEYIRTLQKLVTKPIIKAVRVRSGDDILRAESLSCEYLLLDAYRENEYGGSGKTFDWSVISKVSKPYFLAGGLNQDNAAGAVTRFHPYCIDVSSGVETNGWKDNDKIVDMITKVRSVR
jgi:phosphoribosylanthranilate isomerase